MSEVVNSIRLVLVSLAVCVAGYALVMLGIARVFVPDKAEGSLVAGPEGTLVGSRLIAQKFTEPGYFWPRPSAVDYNAAAAGGSNKSPTSEDLRKRAGETVALYGATVSNPLPAELAAASGGGLDPHVTESGALYQAGRVAAARGLPVRDVELLIRQRAFAPGAALTPARLVNVLELNLALDEAKRR
jgi:K+-transporting ATPase ATPase C chain